MFASEYVATTTTVTTTTETVVATIEISPGAPGQVIDLDGWTVFTTGTGNTGVQLRWRRGNGITGTVVSDSGAMTPIGAAGSGDAYVHKGRDVPGDVTGQVYSLTIQQAGATGNGQSTQAHALAIAHD